MIKITNAEVFGWDAAIRGMRNPMNSWDKSDSFVCEGKDACVGDCYSCIGNADLALMKKLVKAGSDHAKFMRMINVTMDVTAPVYWWSEYDTYKVGTVANSCSKMHKLASKEFTFDDFSHEHLNDDVIEKPFKDIINCLNFFRDLYNQNHDKDDWWQMIQLLPSSYNQKRTVQLNYAVLRNMYHARRNHKLDEWRDFCSWVESLPCAELITLGENDNGKD